MGLILLVAVLPVVWLFLRDDPAEVGRRRTGRRRTPDAARSQQNSYG